MPPSPLASAPQSPASSSQFVPCPDDPEVSSVLCRPLLLHNPSFYRSPKCAPPPTYPRTSDPFSVCPVFLPHSPLCLFKRKSRNRQCPGLSRHFTRPRAAGSRARGHRVAAVDSKEGECQGTPALGGPRHCAPFLPILDLAFL